MEEGLLDGAADIFEHCARKLAAEVDEETVRSLHVKIGELAGETEQNIGLMQLIDRQFLARPSLRRSSHDLACAERGHGVNQKRVRRLMRLMRLMPIYQKPNISKPRKGDKTYPLTCWEDCG